MPFPETWSRISVIDYSVVVFSNGNLEAVKHVSSILARTDCTNVIWAVDQDTEVRDFLLDLDPSVNRVLFSPVREGKSSSFNRCLDHILGRVVFLVSCDMDFEPSAFGKTVSRMAAAQADIAITNVKVGSVSNFAERIGNVLWQIRDAELSYMYEKGRLIHGGEFIAICREYLVPIPEMINEDSYQCIMAQFNGARAVYIQEVTVRNYAPSTIGGLIEQRRRINFGYIQIRQKNLPANVMSFMLPGGVGDFAAIIVRYLKKYGRSLIWLPFLLFTETVSNFLARSDYRKGRNYTLWRIVETSKTKV